MYELLSSFVTSVWHLPTILKQMPALHANESWSFPFGKQIKWTTFWLCLLAIRKFATDVITCQFKHQKRSVVKFLLLYRGSFKLLRWCLPSMKHINLLPITGLLRCTTSEWRFYNALIFLISFQVNPSSWIIFFLLCHSSKVKSTNCVVVRKV